MLPSFLKGTYAIYKEDTDSVASWLASTARRCGYPFDLLSNAAGQVSGQKVPKRKKKKHGKALNPVDTLTTEDNRSNPTPAGPVTYTIAIKDFVSLAEHIVAFQKPPVKVPTAFVKVLHRAIALRKKHNSWFNNAGRTSKGDGHAFCLDTLSESARHWSLVCLLTLSTIASPKLLHSPLLRAPTEATLETYLRV